jgi:hypothetical protein
MAAGNLRAVYLPRMSDITRTSSSIRFSESLTIVGTKEVTPSDAKNRDSFSKIAGRRAVNVVYLRAVRVHVDHPGITVSPNASTWFE